MTTQEIRGRSSGPVSDESDEDASEAQAQVIASLRAQVTDLFSQVTQLNSKLVSSYDRMSDLEDQLHDASASLRSASVTISSLELERSHHLAALNTGLLVEKAHVTAELNRLMERATEEAAQRGQAESARHDIEKDLDDLSASLFDQANTMVAEARLNQARSERKVQDAEQALKIAEDAVKDMQFQMQALQADKEATEREAREAKITMGKGKWVERDDSRVGEVPEIRLMTTHTPYAEFIAFVAHLRGVRASQPAPSVISTLLSQPFIARLLTEDSEPTVRLDLAPSLNWLSRRSVLAAIHTGMLIVEPVPFSSLIQELQHHPQSMSSSSVSCALCGTPIARLPTASPVSRSLNTNGSSWFKYPLALNPTPQNHTFSTPQLVECEAPGQVYIFRLVAASPASPLPALTPGHTSSVSMSGVGTSRPPINPISSTRMLPAQTQNSPYPLCTSNYCLTRLRSTCSLWAFVRVGIVERIWEEEVIKSPKPPVNGDSQEARSPVIPAGAGGQSTSRAVPPLASEKPPVPPRRRRLWEMASALGERAVGWGKEGGESAKEKEKDSAKRLHTPPPSHPSVPHPHSADPNPRVEVQVPPPLPMRNVVRDRTTTGTAVTTPDTQNGAATPETKQPATYPNDPIDPDKADPNTSNDSPVDEIIFVSPPSEASPTLFISSHPVSADTGTTQIQDRPPPPSPHNVPLPMTPTSPHPIPRVTSPITRPRSRVSSPASPPPTSRPVSPAVSRSRAGSPAPAGIPRTASPSPAHSASHFRGKTSISSPLASSRPASPVPAAGPGAPPLPRRAPARRAVPPPPTSGGGKAVAERGKDEGELATVGVTDPSLEADISKEREGGIPGEKESGQGEDEAVKTETAPQPASVPITDAAPAPEGFGVANTTNGEAVAKVTRPSIHIQPTESAPSRSSATVVSDRLPASDVDCAPTDKNSAGRASIDSTSTKRSSSTQGEGFASDARWEERTWKELVRLKEEMFWARIGGLRALQE